MITKWGRVEKKFSELSFNSRLLFKELTKRGVTLNRIRKTHLIKAKKNNHKEVFYDIYSNLLPYTKGLMIDDKYYAKCFLKSHGFPVNPGNVFLKKDIKKAVNYAKKLGFPVVLKPSMSSHGENVMMDIENEKELKTLINKFTSKYIGNVYYLIEKQYKGEEYRLFITKNSFFAAVHRTPASVIGDGRHTIKQLAKKESFRRMHPRNNCLCVIRIDDEVVKYLKNKKISVDYVPAKDERVQIRPNSNVSTGGNCYDVTDEVHSFYIRFAKRILKELDVPFVGIDLLTGNISKKSNDYVICELNSAPGLSLHMMPEKGKPRDVASAIADVIFSETKK